MVALFLRVLPLTDGLGEEAARRGVAPPPLSTRRNAFVALAEPGRLRWLSVAGCLKVSVSTGPLSFGQSFLSWGTVTDPLLD